MKQNTECAAEREGRSEGLGTKKLSEEIEEAILRCVPPFTRELEAFIYRSGQSDLKKEKLEG